MKLFLALLVAIVCIASVQAQVAPCDAPTQFSSRFFRKNHERHVHEYGDYYYDSERQVIAEVIDIFDNRNNGTRVAIQQITDFKTQTVYAIDLNKNICNKGSINYPFMPVGVPPNGTFLWEEVIGSTAVPGGSILVNVWMATGKDPNGMEWFWDGSFTSNGCIPIHFNFEARGSGRIETNVYGVTLGISDPNVFIPPPMCN